MRRISSVLTCVVLGLGFAACGSDSNAKTSGDGGDGAAASGGAKLTLTAKDFAYSPTALQAAADAKTTIVVTNGDSVKHNLTIKDLKIDKDLPAGGSASATFTAKAGTYAFFCEYHPNTMKGTITVP